MFYKQRNDTFIRKFEDLGYITTVGLYNDRVFDKIGSVFLEALTRHPQNIENLADKILKQFVNADRREILADATDFYDTLAFDGFLSKGETEEECRKNDIRFSYRNIDPKTAKSSFVPPVKRAENTTQDFLEKYFDEKPHLTNFQIELTSRCNERCVHCYIPHENKLHDISSETYYSVLSQLHEMNLLGLTLSGGEALLHPQFNEFLKAAQKYDFYVNILSNLTLLTDETVRILRDTTVSSVQVSLYSMNPQHHDTITTVEGSWKKTVASIEKLIANDIPVQISCPVMKQNKDDFGEVLAWAHEHKVRATTDFIMMAEYNRCTENLKNRLSAEETGKIILQQLEGNDFYQNEVLDEDFEERCKSLTYDLERRLCGVGTTFCCMGTNGDIFPCAGWQAMVLGNIHETPLKDIWENSEKIKYLRSLKMKDMNGGECCTCDNVAFCSPCMVRNANESPTGNPLEINRHFCKVAELNKKMVLDWRKNHVQ